MSLMERAHKFKVVILTTKLLWCQELRKNITQAGSTNVWDDGEQRVVKHRQMTLKGFLSVQGRKPWCQLGMVQHSRFSATFTSEFLLSTSAPTSNPATRQNEPAVELEPCGNHPRSSRRRRAEMITGRAQAELGILGSGMLFGAAFVISSLW